MTWLLDVACNFSTGSDRGTISRHDRYAWVSRAALEATARDICTGSLHDDPFDWRCDTAELADLWGDHHEGHLADALVPLQMGNYLLTDLIGSGGFATVYGARDLHTGERVAIKLLKDGSKQPARWFKEEARLLVNAVHPRLVAPDQIVEGAGRFGLVMPHVDGVDFKGALRAAAGEVGPIKDAAAARKIVAGLTDCLHALHTQGYAHRDLKPANVLVDADLQVYLLDFGLSVEPRSTNGRVAGTIAYLAPELLDGTVAGPASDAYAIGTMVYEALAGTIPFANEPDPLIARQLSRAPDLDIARPGMTADWVTLVRALLEREPHRRMSVADVLTWANAKPASPIRRRAFVGRATELRDLARAWRGIEAGGPSLIVEVCGPSGIGKTSLVAKFTASVGASSEVMWGRCFERETIPYKALDQVIATLADVIAGTSAARAILSTEDGAALTRVFPVFRGDDQSVAASTPHDRERAGNALRSLFSVFTRERPVVLVIDDVQWGDSDSADVLAQLLTPPHAPRVLVVTTRRSDLGRGPLLESLTARVIAGMSLKLVEHALGPLDATAVQEFLELTGATGQAARIAASASGHPLLLELLAHPEAQTSRLDTLVSATLARLSEPLRVIAVAAAAAGGVTSLLAIADACRVTVPTRRELAELAASGLVRTCLDDRGHRALIVMHEQLRIALLAIGPVAGDAAASHSAIRELHERLADHAVNTGGDDGVIVRHLLAADRPARAVAHALQAAAAAERKSAFGSVAELLELVTDAGRPDPDGSTRARFAFALRESGQGARAAVVWSQLGVEFAPTERARVWNERAGEALLESGSFDAGIALLDDNLGRLGRRGPLDGKRALFALAWRLAKTLATGGRLRLARAHNSVACARADAYWAAGKCVTFIQPPAGIELLFGSLKDATRSGDKRRVARAQGVIAGTVLALIGPGKKIARRWLAQVDSEARRSADPYLIACSRLWRTLSALSQTHLDDVVEGGMAAIALLENVDDTVWERNQAASFVVRALLTRGDYAACAAMSEAYRRDTRRRGDLYGQMLFGGYATIPNIARGEIAAARLTTSWLRTSWAPKAYTIQRFCASLYDVWCDVLEGDPKRAARRLIEDRPQFRSAGLHRIVFSRMDWAIAEARICLATPDDVPGLRPLHRIAAALRREGLPDATGHAALIETAIAHRRGLLDVARARVDEAIASFERATVHLEPMAAKLWRARLDGDDGARKAAHSRMLGLGILDPERWTDFTMGPS